MLLLRNRPATWLAVIAMALQAFWPLLSQAKPRDLTLLVPLCTVEGVTHYVELKAGRTTPLDERSASHGDHCKLCVLGADKPVALPSTVVELLVPVATLVPDREQPAALAGIFARSLAQPRAPPVVS